jgi:hypothetical protein
MCFARFTLPKMKSILRKILSFLVRHTGIRVVDANTGREITRIWLIGWKGRLVTFGMPNYLPLQIFSPPNAKPIQEVMEFAFKIGKIPDHPRIVPPVDL